MKWYLPLWIIMFCACRSKNPTCPIKVDDVMKGKTSHTITVKDTRSVVTAVYDEGWDSLKGGAYLFYPDGQLKSYTFYQSRKAVYQENYDEQGRLTQIKGSPMVDRVINEINTDTAYVEVYFFKLRKTFRQLQIKINRLPETSYALKDDTLFANMKTATFGLSTTGLSKIDMYTRIQWINECTSAENILSDSLFLVKDPDIRPAPSR
jgi:hypothetical protein